MLRSIGIAVGVFTILVVSPLNAQNRQAAVSYCQGSRFSPCVCWQDVPTTVQYRPTDTRCPKSNYTGDNNRNVASIQLSGLLAGSFSSVVRDVENADRSPYEARTCTRAQFFAGLNKCSRWKVQKTISRGGAKILCLGASGHSSIYKKVTRITVKVSNRTLSNGQKDIRRYCLRAPTAKLNVN